MMQHRIDVISVNDSPMEIFMYKPDGPGPNPGIILAMHIPVGHTGIENDEFTMKAAKRYAENGYAVAVPFVFTGGQNPTISRRNATNFGTIGRNST